MPFSNIVPFFSNLEIFRGSSQDLKKIGQQMNSKNQNVNIYNLKISDNSCFQNLKSAEGTKAKAYAALCTIKNGMSKKMLDEKLEKVKNLKVRKEKYINFSDKLRNSFTNVS